MLLGKYARLFERAARRNREYHFARRRLNPQRIASGLAVPAYADWQYDAVERDLDSSGLARAAIEQRMRRHGTPESDCESNIATLPISMARLGRWRIDV